MEVNRMQDVHHPPGYLNILIRALQVKNLPGITVTWR